ncbi:hypothetical protein CEXT_110281 [Caerostris extrusa]|uniref:Uncharacterized protein n=1 Tax=Caerostris extrusa TaxID=172846 RepID=A0AAV4Q6C4_CAEEX|nr:hypothetical protein CEXT_110281 [Caerostris extrusa]
MGCRKVVLNLSLTTARKRKRVFTHSTRKEPRNPRKEFLSLICLPLILILSCKILEPLRLLRLHLKNASNFALRNLPRSNYRTDKREVLE